LRVDFFEERVGFFSFSLNWDDDEEKLTRFAYFLFGSDANEGLKRFSKDLTRQGGKNL
jgi:hypothetical protein